MAFGTIHAAALRRAPAARRSGRRHRRVSRRRPPNRSETTSVVHRGAMRNSLRHGSASRLNDTPYSLLRGQESTAGPSTTAPAPSLGAEGVEHEALADCTSDSRTAPRIDAERRCPEARGCRLPGPRLQHLSSKPPRGASRNPRGALGAWRRRVSPRAGVASDRDVDRLPTALARSGCDKPLPVPARRVSNDPRI